MKLVCAVEQIKRKTTFLLAVGGGSVLDGTKFMALATKYTGADPWDFMLGKTAT